MFGLPQVTRGMFGANRKKFMEGGIESDYTDESSLYYSPQSMFPPHRADKDVRRRTAKTQLHSQVLLIISVFDSLKTSRKSVWCLIEF